jgi:uncharacterized protein YfcZ (UPF0381/DUF406 family)
MTTIMPGSELTRKAITWICEKQEASAPKSLTALIEEALQPESAGCGISPEIL